MWGGDGTRWGYSCSLKKGGKDAVRDDNICIRA